MKKLLLLGLVILLIVGSCKVKIPLSKAVGPTVFKRGVKIGNTATTATIDSVGADGSVLKIYTGATRVYDDQLLQLAADADDVVWLKTDTGNTHGSILTYDQGVNLLGGGSGSAKIYDIIFIVDTTAGGPVTGDSSFTHTNFIGKYLDVYRGPANSATFSGGLKQTKNTSGVPNVRDGFRLNNATGEIIFRPVFVTNEVISIHSTNNIIHEALSIEGSESTLLTGLRAGWQLDEVSGTAVNDVLGVYDGTTTGTVNQAGKFGVSESFASASSQLAQFGTTVGDVGTNDLSLVAWVYIPTLMSSYDGIVGNWGSPPYYYLTTTGTNLIRGVISFDGVANIETSSNAAVTAATWTHVVYEVDRSGSTALYIDGVLQTDTDDVSASVAVSIANNNQFSIGQVGNVAAGYYFDGRADEVYLYTKLLSGAEILEIMAETYPFNQ